MLNVHNRRYSRMRVFRYREKNCRFWSFARKSWVHILAYVTQWYSRYEILKHQNQIQNVLCLLLKKQCLNHPSSHNCQIFNLFQTKRLPIEKLIQVHYLALSHKAKSHQHLKDFMENPWHALSGLEASSNLVESIQKNCRKLVAQWNNKQWYISMWLSLFCFINYS